MMADTVWLDDASPDTSGGKAATLARLRWGGFEVPDGFVISFEAYRRHVRAAHGAVPYPDRLLVAAIEAGLTHLFGWADGGYVAVRSSAGDEDGIVHSAAGQHHTVLAVRGTDAVAAAVARCWDSLHSARAEAYRRVTSSCGAPAEAALPAMAVLVQQFVDADVSGVVFTGTPRVVEATPGLGAPLVGGAVTPDSWILDDTGIVGRRPGSIRHRLDRAADRLVTRSVRGGAATCLADDQVHAVDRLGRSIATIMGYDADVEWALAGGRLHTLQARAITATLTPAVAAEPSTPGCVTARGIAASPGRTTGAARPLRGPADFRRLRKGDIIVCRTTDPAWTPLFSHAGGVITETGGMLSHAAIVARELSIPAVLAVPDALRRFPDGIRLTLDGTTGTIEC